VGQRIAFLGDSITDGFTYPLLLRQALAEAGKRPLPALINAGIGGDTAAGMRKRLGRDVLHYGPRLVCLSVGINDVLRNVTQEDYETDVAAILDSLKRSRMDVLVLTTSVLGPKHAAAEGRLGGFNAALHQLAGDRGFRVAEVYATMDAARKTGADLLEADQVHLNFEGYRVFTRAVLDGLGYKDVPVPAKLDVKMPPGVVTPWRIKAVEGFKLLDAAAVAAIHGAKPLGAADVAAIQSDATWKELSLPEAHKQDHWWGEQVRQQGYAMAVSAVAGKSQRYVGVATIASPRRRSVYFNTGAGLEEVWLNGRRIYQAGPEYLGFHAGRNRIPAMLDAGENRIVILTGEQFFLSVTDGMRTIDSVTNAMTW
jgi:lysophospholipase L1-like esterase